MKTMPTVADIPNLKKICLASLTGMALFVCALNGCAGAEGKKIVAAIGPEKISLKEFKRDFEELLSTYPKAIQEDAAQVQELQESYLKQIVEVRLIALGAKDLQLAYSGDEVAQKMKLLKGQYTEKEFAEALKKQHVTLDLWEKEIMRQGLVEKIYVHAKEKELQVAEREISDYFAAHPQAFNRPLSIKLREINVPDEKTARDLHSRLLSGANFSQLAQAHSVSPGADKGGEIGYFSPGELPEEIEKVVFALAPGKISDVVKSPYGHHIFLVEERREAKNVSLAEAAEEIKGKLLEQKKEMWFAEWLKGLEKSYPVTINDELLRPKEE